MRPIANRVALACAGALWAGGAWAGCASGAQAEAPAPDALERIGPGMYAAPSPSAARPRGALARPARAPEAPAPALPQARQVVLEGLWRGWRASWGRMDMSRCVLHPSCSRFAREAVGAHGAAGVVLGFARLMRDHTSSHYRRGPRGQALDPVAGYTFFWPRRGGPRAEGAHERWEDPAHAWYEHVQATRARRGGGGR